MVTDDNITERMRFACWTNKGKDIHLEYVILIVFPLQQWFRESASVLCSTCFASFVLRILGLPAVLRTLSVVHCIVFAIDSKLSNAIRTKI